MRLLLAAACVVLIPSLAAAEKNRAAWLSYAAGEVWIESSGKKRAAKKDEALKSGDAVAAGVGAAAVVELADGSQLKLKERSRVVLDLPAARKGGSVEALLSLGGVFAKVTRRAGSSSFRVRAGAAVASVKGTEFFTAFGREAKGGQDLWVCVGKGLVEVGTTASKKTIDVPAGRGILITGGANLTEPQAYEWTKKLNWNMEPDKGPVEDKTDLDKAYDDLLDQDYR
jgi:ferric-dicitrate binding protein FerR (iron transport regulator)